jgi:hypothetical protein
MPTRIKLDDRLADKVAALAAEAGLSMDAFVERVLRGFVDADIELRDGIPVFRMPPGAPVLTSAEVDRLLHDDRNSWVVGLLDVNVVVAAPRADSRAPSAKARALALAASS